MHPVLFSLSLSVSPEQGYCRRCVVTAEGQQHWIAGSMLGPVDVAAGTCRGGCTRQMWGQRRALACTHTRVTGDIAVVSAESQSAPIAVVSAGSEWAGWPMQSTHQHAVHGMAARGRPRGGACAPTGQCARRWPGRPPRDQNVASQRPSPSTRTATTPARTRMPNAAIGFNSIHV